MREFYEKITTIASNEISVFTKTKRTAHQSDFLFMHACGSGCSSKFDLNNYLCFHFCDRCWANPVANALAYIGDPKTEETERFLCKFSIAWMPEVFPNGRPAVNLPYISHDNLWLEIYSLCCFYLCGFRCIIFVGVYLDVMGVFTDISVLVVCRKLCIAMTLQYVMLGKCCMCSSNACLHW